VGVTILGRLYFCFLDHLLTVLASLFFFSRLFRRFWHEGKVMVTTGITLPKAEPLASVPNVLAEQ
jgi:hypothetical protein